MSQDGAVPDRKSQQLPATVPVRGLPGPTRPHHGAPRHLPGLVPGASLQLSQEERRSQQTRHYIGKMTSRHTVYWDMGTMDGLER